MLPRQLLYQVQHHYKSTSPHGQELDWQPAQQLHHQWLQVQQDQLYQQQHHSLRLHLLNLKRLDHWLCFSERLVRDFPCLFYVIFQSQNKFANVLPQGIKPMNFNCEIKIQRTMKLILKWFELGGNIYSNTLANLV